MTIKTLKLFYPEWQGYGENNRAWSGAHSILRTFPQHGFVKIHVPENESLSMEKGILGRRAILRNTNCVVKQLSELNPDCLFMIAGTCGAELAPIAYLNQFYQDDLAVLWLDAHVDMNTPASSPSGHFHGMVLSTLMGEGDSDFLEYVPNPLGPTQIILAGVRDLDAYEAQIIKEGNIAVIGPEKLTTSNCLVDAIIHLNLNNLYIHIDVDVLEPSAFEGAQIPVAGGIQTDTLIAQLSALKDHFNVIGLSIVEFVSTDLKAAYTLKKVLHEGSPKWLSF